MTAILIAIGIYGALLCLCLLAIANS